MVRYFESGYLRHPRTFFSPDCRCALADPRAGMRARGYVNLCRKKLAAALPANALCFSAAPGSTLFCTPSITLNKNSLLGLLTARMRHCGMGVLEKTLHRASRNYRSGRSFPLMLNRRAHGPAIGTASGCLNTQCRVETLTRARLRFQFLIYAHDIRHVIHGLAKWGDVPSVALHRFLTCVVRGEREFDIAAKTRD